ncbi:MAG: ABC transporter ATP-binding protein [Actinomycetia bacterium]|nr:ABC transporter ATP-binding protein [Actinomycetes bacterium]
MPAIVLRGVNKSLRGQPVLQGCSLVVPYGQLVTVLGANGSGKTLLLRILSGLVYADAGLVRVGGVDLSRTWRGPIPPNVGVLIETPGFLPYLSALANLELLAHIGGRIGSQEVRAAIESVGLDPDNPKPVRTYSLGMRQRLAIAQALMEHPRILLLDEPTNALDAEYTPELLQRLRHLADEGCAIVMTTHEVAQVPRVSDQVYALRGGTLQPVGPEAV